jgi:hypothetical protein
VRRLLDYKSSDMLDPDIAGAFSNALKHPQPLAEVEAIERAAKNVFRSQLADPDSNNLDAAHAFVSFFHAVGFLFKYKPYGVKAASPFGYSIFDLYENQGFSFQLHPEPKYEAYHILRSSRGSFVYLSDRAEWESDGQLAALRWSERDQPFSSAYSYYPEPGDVARITATGVVHSVTGCTLEEYASTSLDAVERLLDQNDRAGFQLPGYHPDMQRLVTTLHPLMPNRLATRSESGWSYSEMPAEEPIIYVPDQLLGRRIELTRGAPTAVPGPDGWLKVVVPTTQSLKATVAGRDWIIRPGEIFTVPPGWSAEVVADDVTVVSVQCVAPHLLRREWVQ